jgi:hypothetical protein
MRLLGPLVFTFLLTACSPKALDLHVLAANDLRRVSDHAIAPMRAFCPSPSTSTDCATLTDAQHAFVAAHTEWVLAMDREAHANRWRHPDDHHELIAVCVAYHRLIAAAEAIDVQFIPLDENTQSVCHEVP